MSLLHALAIYMTAQSARLATKYDQGCFNQYQRFIADAVVIVACSKNVFMSSETESGLERLCKINKEI